MDKMILRRLGNKKKLAKEIQKHFPPHKIYIEPFFGAGGMFFNKPKAKYNIVNDLDSDVFNLFQVVMNQKEELEKQFKRMPLHSDLIKYWLENEEDEPIKKALRFLALSNFVLNGRGSTMRLGARNDKLNVYKYLDKTFEFIKDVQFANMDFEKFLKGIEFRGNCFIYCDSPYLGTADNYNNSFNEEQSENLFDCLQQTNCKFAMSEFNNPIILDLAKQHNLEVITIGERQNLKNRRTEILIVNYESPALYGLFSSNNLNYEI
jgi:DNA adenine methylase